MFLEKFWNSLSFDLLPTLPLKLSFFNVFAMLVFVAIPSYIAYAKQSIQRRRIYLFSLVDFVIFYVCFFVTVEKFYFDRGDLTIFAKTLYAILFVGAIFDMEDKDIYPWRKKTFFKKYISHPMESGISHAFLFLFRLMPVRLASWFAGKLTRCIGKTQKYYNRLMDENLKIAFPRMKPAERDKIKGDVWEMMGRYTAEPVHFKTIYHNYKKFMTFENDDVLDELNGKPFIVVISHSGTLGLVSIPLALHKVPISALYKFPSNNLTNGIITRSFGLGIGKVKFVPNTVNGTRDAMKILASGSAMLAVPDQKFINGLPTKFFGADVKSPSGVAKLAAHFNCPILPVQIIRLNGVNHKIVFHKPFMPYHTKDKESDAVRTTQKINDIIEGWIRENPSQWFWVHDRWDIKQKVKSIMKNEKQHKKTQRKRG